MYQSAPPPPPPPFAPPSAYQRPRRTVPVLVPHLIWDAVLLLLVVAVCTAALIWSPLFDGSGVWGTLAINGLIASGLALSLRTGTPNLAVAGLAGVSGVVYAELVNSAGMPWVLAAAVAMIAVLAAGALLGLVAGLTSVPAWAVSLGGLAVLQAVVFGLSNFGPINVSDDLPLGGVGWFVIFVLISLAGGGLLAVPAVRQFLSANRTSGDPVRFAGRRLVGALVGFVGSSALAGLAGLAVVSHYGVFDVTFADVSWLLVGLAAALLGGVSAFGGRGGVAGTVFGTVLVVVGISWLAVENLFQPWGRLVLIGLAILIGVGVSRVMEAIAPVEPADPAPAPVGAPAGPPPGAPGGLGVAPTTAPGQATVPQAGSAGQAPAPERSAAASPTVQDSPPPPPPPPPPPAQAAGPAAASPARAAEPATEPLRPETGTAGEPRSGSSTDPERS